MGLGIWPLGAGEGDGAFIHRGAGEAPSLRYSFSFIETRPDIGETKIRGPILRTSVDANATDVGVPWRNTPFYDELIQWIVWREGRAVMAISNTGQRASLELPEEPATLVMPPLKTKGGPVEVLALSNTKKELTLVRFTPAGLAQLGWSAPLPAVPSVVTTALGPVGLGSERHVGFAAPSGNGIELFHGRFTETGALGRFASCFGSLPFYLLFCWGRIRYQLQLPECHP